MRLSLTLLLVLAQSLSISATQGPLSADKVQSPRLSNFSEYVDEVGRAFNAPGLALAVVRKGQAPEFFSWGRRTENGDPVDPDTLFSIGSCSKAFNSASMGILIDDFKNNRNVTPLPTGVELDWTTKILDLLPGEWVLQDEWTTSKASILDIYSHVTGLNRHEFSYDSGVSAADVVHSLRYLRPSYEFREKWQYNNLMYATAAHIISTYSLQSYPSFVKERIFNSLAMTQATYYPQQAFDSGHLAELWIHQAGPNDNETRLVPYFLDDWSDHSVEGFLAGAGGVISSTKDLAKWVASLLSGGTLPETGKHVIPSTVLDTVMTGRSIMDPKATFPELSPRVYGAGWWRFSYLGHEVVQHGGTVTGSSTVITLLPNDGIGIVALCNGNSQHDALNSLTYRAIEDSFGLEHVDWPGRLLSASQTELTVKQQSTPGGAESFLLPLSHFIGTYAKPGYVGNFTLCAWPAEHGTECEEVLKGFSLVDADFEAEKSSTLYASWPRFWSSHMKLTQQNNVTFGLVLETLYVDGYGKNNSPFFYRGTLGNPSLVEFGIENGEVVGLGMWGIEAGPQQRAPSDPQNSSEAWFDRMT